MPLRNRITSKKLFTVEDVAKHNKEDDLWLIVEGGVYDFTQYLSKHPGGSVPLRYAGKDASKVFSMVHASWVLEKAGKPLLVGQIKDWDKIKSQNDKKGATKGVYSASEDKYGYDKRKSSGTGREFGDLMAKEGETGNIPYVIITMYAALAVWGYLTSYMTECSPWLIFYYYLAGMFAFYLWHVLAHSEWSGEMNEIHMEHHLLRYPPSDFYGSAELFAQCYPDGQPTIWSLMDLTKTTNIADGTSAGSEGIGLGEGRKKHTPLVHEGPLLIALLAIIGIGRMVFKTSYLALGFVFILYFVLAAVGNALHVSFHVRHFHLENYSWYRELRTLHYIHHLGDMKSNLAMLNLGMDGLFRSLAVVGPKDESEDNAQPYADLANAKSDDELPEGISRKGIHNSARYSGIIATLLGFDVPLECTRDQQSYPTVLLRILLTFGALRLWYNTERAIEDWIAGSSSLPSVTLQGFTDPGHRAFRSVGSWLEASGLVQPACALSALLSEATMTVVVVTSNLGTSFRPLLSIIMVFNIRLALRLLGAAELVPLCPSSKFELPESWPSLFVQRGVGSGVFFSGRSAVSAVAAMELFRIALHSHRHKALRILAAVSGMLYLGYNVVLSLALGCSWSFDLVIALICARYATIAGHRMAGFVDAFLP